MKCWLKFLLILVVFCFCFGTDTVNASSDLNKDLLTASISRNLCSVTPPAKDSLLFNTGKSDAECCSCKNTSRNNILMNDFCVFAAGFSYDFNRLNELLQLKKSENLLISVLMELKTRAP